MVCLASSGLFAEDLTPPIVGKAISDLTVAAGTAQSVVKLKKTFALSGVTGQVVRFSTSLGNMDVELDTADYPLNVANFLAYVNSGRYNDTFIHRSISGFIFQGGGYHEDGNLNYHHIDKDAAVTGEHKASNVRGTIAFALTSGTNSADTGTSEWFFNLADNIPLDTYSQNQGPFTAFGRVIGSGLTTMDAIANVLTYDLSKFVTSSDDGIPNFGVFTDVPLNNYDSSQGTNLSPDLVRINQVSIIPLLPAATGDPALLKVKVKGNTNPGLVTATLNGKKLTLAYTAGQTGSATITLLAKDSGGGKVKTSFNVTVQ